MEEKVILVDENDKETGIAEKMEAHRKGFLHRAFSVLIFNHQGEMLLQKRNLKKYHSGGLWSNTCCGHPRPGENIVAAAERRLNEEMGIKVKLREDFNFIYKVDFKNGIYENEYDHVLKGEIESYEKKPDPNEVSEWKWVDMSELKEEMQKNPEKFSYWFKIIMDKYDR